MLSSLLVLSPDHFDRTSLTSFVEASICPFFSARIAALFCSSSIRSKQKHVDSEFKQLFRLAVTHDERRSLVLHLLRKQSIRAHMVIILRSLLNALRRRNICLTLVARATPKEQGLHLGRCKTSQRSQSWACRSLAGTGTVST